jgi:hypothetical protein
MRNVLLQRELKLLNRGVPIRLSFAKQTCAQMPDAVFDAARWRILLCMVEFAAVAGKAAACLGVVYKNRTA